MEVKISRLEIGALIEDGEDEIDKEFISTIKGPAISTLQRVPSGAILQTAYLITQDNGTGPTSLLNYASELLRPGDKKYDKLNERLEMWEKTGATV